MADHSKRSCSRWGGLWVLLGDFLLTACALTGFFLSFLSLYTSAHSGSTALSVFCLQHGTVQLFFLSLCLALAAAVLWSLPRFRALAAGLFALGWSGYVLLVHEDFRDGAQLTAKVIADLFEDRVGWFGTLQLDLALTSSQELLAIERFLFPALCLLAFALGWAVVRGRRWWVAVVFTLPPLLPGLLADVYPSWPAFLLLCCCWCTMVLTDLCKWAAPSGRGRLTLAVLPAVGVVLLLISALFPLEGYERPQWTYTAEDALVDFGNKHLAFLSGLDGPFTSRVTYVGSAETVDLNNAGPLNYSGRTVLKVTSEDYTGLVYLRGVSLANYADNRWEAMDSGLYRQYSDRLNDTYAPFPLTFPSFAAMDVKECTMTVENTGASGACAYAPYHLTDQDWTAAGVLPVEDAYLAREDGLWSHTYTFIPHIAIDSGFNSNLPAKTRYEQFVYASYLDVPKELVSVFEQTGLMIAEISDISTTDISDIASDIAAAGDGFFYTVPVSALSMAQTVAEYLAETCRYDPDTPAVPEGEDFVAYFLTESHEGYCMHFASAATLMLRWLGIPARYVSGFAAEVTARETTNVPDSASHAWVEVYVDGYGWYPVEVTPGYVEEDVFSAAPVEPTPEEPSETPELPSHTPSVSDSPEPSLSPAPSGSQTVEQELPQQPSGFIPFLRKLVQGLKWLAMAAAIFVLLWLGQYLPKRYRAKKLASPDTNRAVLYGYRCLTRLKKWGGAVPDHILELAQKARFSQHTLTEEERKTVTDHFDGERRRLSAALSPIKKAAFHYLWSWPSTPKEEHHDHS